MSDGDFRVEVDRAARCRSILAEYSAILAMQMAGKGAQNLFWPTHDELFSRNPYVALFQAPLGRGETYIQL